MKLELGDNKWAYFLDKNFKKKSIWPNTDLSEGELIVLKSKQYTETDKMYIQTDYYVVDQSKLKRIGKNTFQALLSREFIHFIKLYNFLPTDASIENYTEDYLLIKFDPDKYDSFEISIGKEQLGKDITSKYINELQSEELKLISAKQLENQVNKIITSHSVAGSSSTYTVDEYGDGKFTCTCPHFKFRAGPKGEYCKHIYKIKEQKIKQETIKSSTKPTINTEIDDDRKNKSLDDFF